MDEILIRFEDEKIVEPQPKPMPKVHKTGGRGKKQCQNENCGVFVGVRNKACPVCNTPFIKKEKSSKKEVESAIISEANAVEKEPMIIVKTAKEYNNIIWTPAGKCPISPPLAEEFSKETIIAWADTVRNWYLEEKGDYLTGRAIAYFARYKYNSLTSEYKYICSVIKEWEESL